MSTIGDRIKSLRKIKGWKQQELGDYLGVSPQVISNWERDYSYPDHKDIIELTRILGTSADYLLGLVDDIFQDQVDLSDITSNQQDQGAVNIDLIKLFNSDYELLIDGYKLNEAEKDTLKSIVFLISSLTRSIKQE